MSSAKLRPRRASKRSRLSNCPTSPVGVLRYDPYDPYYSDDEFADDMSDGEEEGFVRDVLAQTSKSRGGVAFQKKHLRNPAENTEQEKTIASVRSMLAQHLAMKLVEQNEMLKAGSDMERKLKMGFLGMQNYPHRGTYHIKETGKDGRSVHLHLRNRSEGYPNLTGTMTFNHSYCSSDALDIIDEAFDKLKEISGMGFEGNLKEMSITDAIKSEKNGNLSFFVRLFFDSLGSNVDGTVFGGARSISGMFPAFMLNCVETAQQEMNSANEEIGLSRQAEMARQDEHLHFNAMEWVIEADQWANKELRALFEELVDRLGVDWLKNKDIRKAVSQLMEEEEAPEEEAPEDEVASDEESGAPDVLPDFEEVEVAEVAVEEEEEEEVDIVVFSDGSILVVDSSWAPKLKHNDVAATVLFYDNVVFDVMGSKEMGLWRDAFVDTCKIDGKGSRYNAKEGFTAAQRRGARETRLRRLRRLIAKGGIGIFDVCNEMYRDVDYTFLDELEKEGLGKHAFVFRFLNCSFYCMTKGGVKTLAVVHDPPCPMLQSSSESRIQWDELARQAFTAQTNHFIDGFIRNLGNAGDLSTIKTNQSVMQNCLMTYGERVYVLCPIHGHSMSASLLSKNLLDRFRNVCDGRYHDLSASKRGRNLREQRRASREASGKQDEDASEKNMWIKHNLMFLMLRLSSDGLSDNGIVDNLLQFITDRQIEDVGDNREELVEAFVDECVEDAGLKKMILKKFRAIKASEQAVTMERATRNARADEEEHARAMEERDNEESDGSGGSDWSNMPPYPGLRHSMEVQTGIGIDIGGDAVEEDSEDWAVQYQAFLDEQKLDPGDETRRKETVANNDAEDIEGEDWAIQYAQYCEEKERDFFESNRIETEE